MEGLLMWRFPQTPEAEVVAEAAANGIGAEPEGAAAVFLHGRGMTEAGTEAEGGTMARAREATQAAPEKEDPKGKVILIS